MSAAAPCRLPRRAVPSFHAVNQKIDVRRRAVSAPCPRRIVRQIFHQNWNTKIRIPKKSDTSAKWHTQHGMREAMVDHAVLSLLRYRGRQSDSNWWFWFPKTSIFSLSTKCTKCISRNRRSADTFFEKRLQSLRHERSNSRPCRPESFALSGKSIRLEIKILVPQKFDFLFKYEMYQAHFLQSTLSRHFFWKPFLIGLTWEKQ